MNKWFVTEVKIINTNENNTRIKRCHLRLVIVGMEEDTENPWENNFRKGAQMETRFLDLKKETLWYQRV